MSRRINLRTAGKRISVSYKIMEECLKAGCYEEFNLTVRSRSSAGGRAGLLARTWVRVDALPALLERTWEYVLYERPTPESRKGTEAGGQSGPWVPCSEVAKWLQAQIRKRAHAARGEPNPAVMTNLANDLGVDPRRLYAWATAQYTHIPYCLVEECLWEYACLKPEDVCPRELMIISKPPVKKKRKKEAS